MSVQLHNHHCLKRGPISAIVDGCPKDTYMEFSVYVVSERQRLRYFTHAHPQHLWFHQYISIPVTHACHNNTDYNVEFILYPLKINAMTFKLRLDNTICKLLYTVKWFININSKLTIGFTFLDYRMILWVLQWYCVDANIKCNNYYEIITCSLFICISYQPLGNYHKPHHVLLTVWRSA